MLMGMTGIAVCAVNTADYNLFWPGFFFHPWKNPTQECCRFAHKHFGCKRCFLASGCWRLGCTRAASELRRKGTLLSPSSHTHLQHVLHGHGYTVCMAVATRGIVASSPQPRGLQHCIGSAAGAGRTWYMERAGFVRLDLSVWVFSEVLDDPCGSCVRPGIALLEQGVHLQV